MDFKPGDIVWVRGTVFIAPEGSPVVLVNFTGPGGAQVPAALDREGPIEPEAPPT